jgi:hypothetical protein
MKKIISFIAIFLIALASYAQTNFEGTVKYSIQDEKKAGNIVAEMQYPFIKANFYNYKWVEDTESFLLNFAEARIYIIYDSLKIAVWSDLPNKKYTGSDISINIQPSLKKNV